MCRIFAGQDPGNYAFQTRSIRLDGYATSVRLESKFWETVDAIAALQDMTTPQFLTLVYSEAEEIHGQVSNFASLLRCACLLYLQQPEVTLAIAHSQRDTAPDAAARESSIG